MDGFLHATFKYERLHKKFGIYENPVKSEKRSYAIPAPEGVYLLFGSSTVS